MECRHIVAWRSSCRGFEHCLVSPDNKHLQLCSSPGASNMFDEHQQTTFTRQTAMVCNRKVIMGHNLCVLPGALPTGSHRSQFVTLWKICSDKVTTTLGTRHGFARIRLTEVQDSEIWHSTIQRYHNAKTHICSDWSLRIVKWSVSYVQKQSSSPVKMGLGVRRISYSV